MTNAAPHRRLRWRSVAEAAAAGGLLSGALDLLYASLAYPVPFVRILQSIASGWTGAAAYRGGEGAAVLGLISHFAILVIAAGLFAAAARRLPVLRRRPVSAGLGYGALIYGVMTFAVVPASRATLPPPSDAIAQLPHLFAHMLLVGLPIALVAAQRAGLAEPPRA